MLKYRTQVHTENQNPKFKKNKDHDAAIPSSSTNYDFN